MDLRIDVYHHFEGGVLIEGVHQTQVDRKLNKILEIVQGLKREETIMNQEMQVMADKITAFKTVEDGAAGLITGMAAQLAILAQNSTDLAQMKADALALAQTFTDNSVPLVAAVVANTPAAPVQPAAPTV